MISPLELGARTSGFDMFRRQQQLGHLSSLVRVGCRSSRFDGVIEMWGVVSVCVFSGFQSNL